jgi:hypothetical protein
MAVAGIVYALREIYAPSSMTAAIAALAAYVVFGPLLDRRFLADIRQLLTARRSANPAPLASDDSGVGAKKD